MKWIARILALYMLVLSCLPCNDSTECSNNSDTSIVAGAQHSDHSNHPENCTPFCSCACCGIHITQLSEAIFIAAPHQLITQHSLYKPAYIPATYYNIWQPPRLHA